MPGWLQERVQQGVVVLALGWCVAAAVAGLTRTRAQPQSDQARRAAGLEAVVTDLPATGTIGYIDATGTEDVQVGAAYHGAPNALHVAQYVLAPRIVRVGPGPAFIVVHGAAADDASARLPGYEPVGRGSGPYLVYRRTR